MRLGLFETVYALLTVAVFDNRFYTARGSAPRPRLFRIFYYGGRPDTPIIWNWKARPYWRAVLFRQCGRAYHLILSFLIIEQIKLLKVSYLIIPPLRFVYVFACIHSSTSRGSISNYYFKPGRSSNALDHLAPERRLSWATVLSNETGDVVVRFV